MVYYHYFSVSLNTKTGFSSYNDSKSPWHYWLRFYLRKNLTDSVDTTLHWLSFIDSLSDDFRRLSFWARSCCTLPCKWRNSLAVLLSSPSLGLGVVELRLVPTPLSAGEEWPFTMGLPAGVWAEKVLNLMSDFQRQNGWFFAYLQQLWLASVLYLNDLWSSDRPRNKFKKCYHHKFSTFTRTQKLFNQGII